jgi:hypothetical protein
MAPIPYTSQRSAFPGVYFIQWGKYIKVGCSDNVFWRRRALELSIPEGDVVGLGWIRVQTSSHRQPATEEYKIHQALAAYRVRGEWFRDCLPVRRFIARYARPWSQGPA